MRSGYTDDFWTPEMAMYRGQVASAMRGKRGQGLLRDCLAALDEMPQKRLIANDLVTADGDVCLLGAGGHRRGIEDINLLDPEEHDVLARRFNVAPCLIREIEYVNDEEGPWSGKETPEERYQRVRKWLVENIATA